VSANCPDCGRPESRCYTPVDERFPSAARDAFAAHGYKSAATCPAGQLRDMRAVGWCYDRARFSRHWRGRELTPAERKGAGISLEYRPPGEILTDHETSDTSRAGDPSGGPGEAES